MRIDTLWLLAGLLFAVALLAPASRARADVDPVLARLSRIARGQWSAPSTAATRAVPYAAKIRTAALRHGVSPALLASLVRAESGFNPRAVSSAGARGLGQLMPSTARALGVRDSFDPDQNLDGSARYLAEQYRRFSNVHQALAAYNAGPRVAAKRPARWPAETRQYITRVMRFEREYRARNLP